ncbi:MAG: LOG family protein [Alphaproteobacteria bacterium]
MAEKKVLKAYENDQFIQSRDGRILRIMSEFIEPQSRLEDQKISDTIVFFGSARAKPLDEALAQYEDAKEGKNDLTIAAAEKAIEMAKYYEQARELSFKLTEWSKELEENRKRFVICTGGGPGMMEAANRGASEARGKNMGFNISLPFEQGSNPWVTNSLSFEFHYFFMRKFWFAYLAKAIIIFPGGFGTFDELFEVLTLIQTKKMEKKVPLILFGSKFWDDVFNFDKLAEWGVISPKDLNLFYRTDDVDDAFNYLTEELNKHALAKPGEGLK